MTGGIILVVVEMEVSNGVVVGEEAGVSDSEVSLILVSGSWGGMVSSFLLVLLQRYPHD